MRFITIWEKCSLFPKHRRAKQITVMGFIIKKKLLDILLVANCVSVDFPYPMTHPWEERNIYLYMKNHKNHSTSTIHVGEYTIPMNGMGPIISPQKGNPLSWNSSKMVTK